jgi:hypothetical protein
MTITRLTSLTVLFDNDNEVFFSQKNIGLMCIKQQGNNKSLILISHRFQAIENIVLARS